MSPRHNPRNSILTAAAETLGVTSLTLHRYIAGRQRPRLPMLRKIEETWGWPVDAQIRLLPDTGREGLWNWGMILVEVLKEHYADEIDDPDFPPATPPPAHDRSKKNLIKRASPGWSHHFIADNLGTKTANVTRWLNGDRYPDVRQIRRIEEIWGWPATKQIVLISPKGYDNRYGDALRAWLDKCYPIPGENRIKAAPAKQLQHVTKITPEKS